MSGLLINYNAAAVAAYNNLDQTSASLTKTVGQLSSGMQIQSAADNPAGYVVGQSLQMEANGYTQAISNAQDAVSVLQTAQGALGQEATILQTMNTLATQAANGGSQTASSQAAAQAEFASLTSQLDQIASSTNYGGTSLLNGSYAGTFQVGPYNQTVDQISVSISGAGSTALLGSTALSLTTTTGAQAAMAAVQTAIGTVATIAASVGASQNEITAVSANLTTAQQNIQSAHANLVDVNVAQMTSQFTSQQILEQAGVSILAQASQLPSLAQKLLP